MKVTNFVCGIVLLMGLLQACSDHEPQNDPSGYNNDAFMKPNIITPLTLPDSWPTNIHRNPQNLSPDESNTNYNSGDNYDPLGLVNEIKAGGFDGDIHSSMDADVY